MGATKKAAYENLRNEADENSQEQINDIFNQISSLGSGGTSSVTVEPIDTNEEDYDDEPIIRRTPQKKNQAKKEKKGNSGYVSLVIPENLKTKWKVFCSEHDISLTDSIRLGMKLLMEMEEKEMISIEDGVITMNM